MTQAAREGPDNLYPSKLPLARSCNELLASPPAPLVPSSLCGDRRADVLAGEVGQQRG
jgi:hypothetical protein